VWIGPIIVLIASILLGPLLVSDVFGEEKVPEKYAPDRLLIKFKNDEVEWDAKETLERYRNLVHKTWI